MKLKTIQQKQYNKNSTTKTVQQKQYNKNSKGLTVFLLGVLLTIFVTDCKKEINTTKHETVNKPKSLALITNQADLLLSIDSIGQDHNNYLNYIATRPTFSGTLTAQQKFNLGSTYVDIWGNTNTFTNWSEFAPMLSKIQTDSYRDFQIGDSIKNKYNLSNISAVYINRLLDIISRGYHIEYANADYWNTAITQINLLQTDILNNMYCAYNPNGRLMSEGAMLLGACSIAKYSITYWKGVIDNPNNPRRVQFVPTSPDIDLCANHSWFGHGWRVAWADVSGWFGSWHRNAEESGLTYESSGPGKAGRAASDGVE
jgi:hypothetical protein